jgi:hypothetical protein
LEEGGIATVVIAIRAFRDRLKAMQLPRLVITPHPMGRPLGAPGDVERQRAVIQTALGLLESADRAGALVELEGAYQPGWHGSR